MKTLFAVLLSATLLAAQAPQVGLIAPLPPPEPASTFDVSEKSIVELLAAQRIGTVTSHDLVEKYLARIKAYDHDGPSLNAMIAFNPKALEQADALDAERRAGHVRGPLHGIPIVVKDNYATADMPTTAGSLALAGFETGRDAFMVKKLRDAGAVVIGKTNLHELAYGITSISSAGGQTRNPYDPTRNPGGSSGGTGAAVAASFAAAGMGTDTCGSIRNPSSENSLWGLRGTFGLSSRDGIVPLAHSQDIGGPLARTVGDLLLMLDATVGVDPADPTTRESQGHIPRTYNGSVGDAGLGDVTIGMLTPLFGSAPEDEEVARIVRDAARRRSRRSVPASSRFHIPGSRNCCAIRASSTRSSSSICRISSAKFSIGADALARRYPGQRQISPGGRRRAEARQRGRLARLGELPRVAREARAGAQSHPVADERTEPHRVRLSDAAPQASRSSDSRSRDPIVS